MFRGKQKQVTPYVEAKSVRPAICDQVSATKTTAGVSRNAVKQFPAKKLSIEIASFFFKTDSMAVAGTFLGGA